MEFYLPVASRGNPKWGQQCGPFYLAQGGTKRPCYLALGGRDASSGLVACSVQIEIRLPQRTGESIGTEPLLSEAP